MAKNHSQLKKMQVFNYSIKQPTHPCKGSGKGSEMCRTGNLDTSGAAGTKYRPPVASSKGKPPKCLPCSSCRTEPVSVCLIKNLFTIELSHTFVSKLEVLILFLLVAINFDA